MLSEATQIRTCGIALAVNLRVSLDDFPSPLGSVSLDVVFRGKNHAGRIVNLSRALGFSSLRNARVHGLRSIDLCP